MSLQVQALNRNLIFLINYYNDHKIGTAHSRYQGTQG